MKSLNFIGIVRKIAKLVSVCVTSVNNRKEIKQYKLVTPFSRFNTTLHSDIQNRYPYWQYTKELSNPVKNMTYENFLSITSSYSGRGSLNIRTANVKTDNFMTNTGWTIFSNGKDEFNLAYAAFKVIWRTTGQIIDTSVIVLDYFITDSWKQYIYDTTDNIVLYLSWYE